MPETYPFTCVHCGQSVTRDGIDERGQSTCGEYAADEDMQNEPHDFDLGPV